MSSGRLWRAVDGACRPRPTRRRPPRRHRRPALRGRTRSRGSPTPPDPGGGGTNLNHNCLSDGRGAYGANERCTIRANLDLYVSTTYYSVEYCCDYLTINGQIYRSRNAPFNVRMRRGDTMQWRSDGSINYGGFVVCADSQPQQAPSPPPPPSPRPPPPPPSLATAAAASAAPNSMFTVVSGGEYCVITNASQCVSDGATNYGNLQRCVIRANQNLYATATYYAVETYDYLTIYTPTVSSTGSASYRTRNNPGPQDVFMRQGTPCAGTRMAA